MEKLNIIIPAAGKATRMRPISNSMSKAMISINGKPIISYIIDELSKMCEINKIVIVHSELNDIVEYVSKKYSNHIEEKKILFAKQQIADGPLSAISIGNELLTEHKLPVLVWLGDTVCVDEMFNFDHDFLAVSKVKDYSRWCLVDDNINFYDKPEIKPNTQNALIGIYFFKNCDMFNDLLKVSMNNPKIKNEHQISSLLNEYKKNVNFNLHHTDNWYDCGDLFSYYESKNLLLNKTARSFNQLFINLNKGTVKKTALKEYKNKIELEKKWYMNVPDRIAVFCPKLVESEYGSLTLSLESGIPLSEMWVYENLNNESWINIFDRLFKIQHEVFYESLSNSEIDSFNIKSYVKNMYLDKNLDRLNFIKKTYNFPEYDTVYSFIKNVGYELINSPLKMSKYFHGDFHFGNILFDSLNGTFRFIDPRGSFGGLNGTIGDLRYDMAKMIQDVYLNYSNIILSNFKVIENKIEITTNSYYYDDLLDYIKIKLTEYGYDANLIFKLAIVLVVTCIPFHTDNKDKQLALWLTALDKIKNNF